METVEMIPTTSAEEQITELTNEIIPSPATAGNEPTVLRLRGGSDTSSDVSYGITREYDLTEDTSLSYLMDALANEERKNVESASALILNYQELYVRNNPDYPKWTMEDLKKASPLIRQSILQYLQYRIELDKDSRFNRIVQLVLTPILASIVVFTLYFAGFMTNTTLIGFVIIGYSYYRHFYP